jgi:5'-methylthioadenosine phosphorylase
MGHRDTRRISMTTDLQAGARGVKSPVRIGIIGGSGLYRMEGLSDVEERSVSTPFGEPSDDVIIGKLDGVPVAFLARHGRGHRLMPTEVNYRANMFALKSLGVEQIIAVSACGSLREQIHPGEVVIPNQLLDFTKKREVTFFGDGLVAHIGTAKPFCPRLSILVGEAVEAAGGTVHPHGNFVTIEGPRFSTKAESFTFRSWDMDIIGMTTSPEAFLAREAEMCYAVMAHVTDYDVWHETEEEVTVEAVIRVLRQNTALAQRAIGALVPELVETERVCECGEALATAIITDRDAIPEETKRKLAPIVGKYLE